MPAPPLMRLAADVEESDPVVNLDLRDIPPLLGRVLSRLRQPEAVQGDGAVDCESPLFSDGLGIAPVESPTLRQGVSCLRAALQTEWGQTKLLQVVDWAILQSMRVETLRSCTLHATPGPEANGGLQGDVGVQGERTPPAHAASTGVSAFATVRTAATERERLMSLDELCSCWMNVVEAEQLRKGRGPLSERDRELIDLRVAQSFRELDPHGRGQVDADLWLHHILLTRSKPPCMRAMLQLNRLLEFALAACPGILVALQHALEVAREKAAKAARDTCSGSKCAGRTGHLPFGELVGIFSRKLWQFRPRTQDWQSRRKVDFNYASPEDFTSVAVSCMDLEMNSLVSISDFLALCLGRREWEVSLHLYDLSRGLATLLSPWLLHQTVEGVWHTGLVVYGKEYYFGGDIYFDKPGATGFGVPQIVLTLGTTLRQRDELHTFVVDELKPLFSREAYDAARNNCNHFTNRVSMYLVGKHIPEEVLLQPELMLQTSVGRAIRPILTRWLGKLFEPTSTAEDILQLSLPNGPHSIGCQHPCEDDDSNSEQVWDATFAL